MVPQPGKPVPVATISFLGTITSDPRLGHGCSMPEITVWEIASTDE
jgi:hypothetical protein